MLRVAIILVSLAACLAASALISGKKVTLETRRRSSPSNLRIIGGNATTIQEHPYQASILRFGYFFCSATIVHKRYLLTLADCLLRREARELQIRVGSSYVQKGGRLYEVKSFVFHPNYNHSAFRYDVALIQLKKPLKFNRNVHKIALATTDLTEGRTVVLSGWGSTSALSDVSNLSDDSNFNAAKLAGVSRTTCNNTYASYGYPVDSSMLCAAASGAGPCDEDFGDPIVGNKKLYGVFAFAMGCAIDGYPPVFASVPASASWIRKVIKS